MTRILLDPTDPSKAFIGSASEATFGAQIGDALLVNVHDAARCAGRACVVHAPSDHHMREWNLNWRGDKGVMERLCPHGVGHPDPDDAAYQVSVGRGWANVHGCDGCCQTPTRDQSPS